MGTSPALWTPSMNLAEVPNSVIDSASAKSKSTRPCAWNGEPSYSSSVASEASAVTSQFHIIQPQVVK
jgi:hypothetical protein